MSDKILGEGRSAHSGKNWQAEWENQKAVLLDRAPQLEISVCSPEVIGSMMSKFVLYSVKTEPSSLLVKRRFSDFVILRDILIQRYPGMFIPNLPSSTPFNLTKTVVSRSSTDINSEFVKGRIYQLNIFLQELYRIPFIACDSSFEGFLTIQDDYKIYIESSIKSTSPAQQPGALAWKSILESVPVNVDIDRVILGAKRQIESLRTILRQYEAQCLNIERQAIINAKEVNTLTTIISTWSSLESEFGDPSKSDPPNAHAVDISNTLKAFHTTHDIWSRHAQVIPRLISHSITHSIQFQANQLEGFRDYLLYRETLIRDLARAEKEVVKALEDKSRSSSSSSAGSPGVLSFFGGVSVSKDEVYAKKVEIRDYLQLTADYVSRGILYSEVDRFNLDRCRFLTSLVGLIVYANQYVSSIFAKKWEDLKETSVIRENDGKFKEFLINIMESHQDNPSPEET